MSDIHAGYIHDWGVYAEKNLMDIYGVEDARTVRKWLDDMGAVWIRGPRGGRVYTGYQIRLAIERNASCDGKMASGSAC